MNTTTRKSTATAPADHSFEMAASASLDLGMSEDDALLAAMIGELPDDELGMVFDDDDIVEVAAAAPPEDVEAVVAELVKAESDLEANTVEAGDEDEAAAPQEAAVAPVKKEKKAKEPKPAAPPRITYVGHSTSEVLVARLGEKKGELLILEVADVALEPEALLAKQELLLSDIDKLAKKVGEKSVMLFGWLRNGGKLNDVMARAFAVLAADGELTSGKKGNLHTNLAEKFSPGTADSQGNQMFMLFPALAITIKEKGRMIANPNSLILMKAKAELGLA